MERYKWKNNVVYISILFNDLYINYLLSIYVKCKTIYDSLTEGFCNLKWEGGYRLLCQVKRIMN